MNAICQLGIVPVRSKPTDSSEMVTQLLYGEQCYVTENTNNWLEIESIFDGYRGFVDKLQLTPINTLRKAAYITRVTLLKINELYLPMGSEISRDELTSEVAEIMLSRSEIRHTDVTLGREDVTQTALALIGSPYMWGGKSLLGIDCSGLSQVVYKSCGYNIPRDSVQQAELGQTVDLADAKNGDLAFFHKTGKQRISHVGIVDRKDDSLKIIHASGQVRIDQLTRQGIIREDGVCTHEFSGLKDIISS